MVSCIKNNKSENEDSDDEDSDSGSDSGGEGPKKGNKMTKLLALVGIVQSIYKSYD